MSAAEPSNDPFPRLIEHMGKLKGLSFWILQMTPTDNWPPPPEPGSAPDPAMIAHFVEHLDWLQQQERDGVLLLSGTVDQEYGIGPGMAIIRAGSREAAVAIAESEPFHRLGLRANTIKSWTVNEGSVTVTIKLFDNTIALT
jgi:uncharacterized protein YciI